MRYKPLLLLLIDDDEDDRELFQLAVEDASVRVECITIKSGYEALTMLSQRAIRPDFIFLDLNMPEMDGRECLAELKKSMHLKGIPVVIFSTSSDPRDVKETRELGAVHFISKPSQIQDLTESVDSFLITQTTK